MKTFDELCDMEPGLRKLYDEIPQIIEPGDSGRNGRASRSAYLHWWDGKQGTQACAARTPTTSRIKLY